MVSAAPAGDLPLDRLVVKSGGSTSLVRVADIDWIEAAGVFANLHIGGKELWYRVNIESILSLGLRHTFCLSPLLECIGCLVKLPSRQRILD